MLTAAKKISYQTVMSQMVDQNNECNWAWTNEWMTGESCSIFSLSRSRNMGILVDHRKKSVLMAVDIDMYYMS